MQNEFREGRKSFWHTYTCKGTKLGMKFIIYGWMQLKRLNGISCTFCTTTEISQTTFEFHECGIAKDAMKCNAHTKFFSLPINSKFSVTINFLVHT